MRKGTRLVAGLLAAALCALPLGYSGAQAQPKSRKQPPVNLATAAPGLLGFTPAAADPKLAASLSRAGSEKMFRFTPSGSLGSKKSVTVAMRSRNISRAESAQANVGGNETTASSGYNLGVSIGWSRFALSGGVSKFDAGLAPFGRESVDVGVSYLGRNWRTTLQLGSEHEGDGAASALGRDQSYSVDLGGAYALSRNLSLSGGVRYKRDEMPGLLTDSKRDSQSIYVGTTFSF